MRLAKEYSIFLVQNNGLFHSNMYINNKFHFTFAAYGNMNISRSPIKYKFLLCWDAIAALPTSIRFDYFISARVIQLVKFSFQRTLASQPLAVITGAWRLDKVSVKSWSRGISIDSSYMNSYISSRRPVSLPSELSMLSKFLVMKLTDYSSIWPPGNYT